MDIIRKFCLLAALGILVITVLICIQTVVHLHCIPKSSLPAEIPSKIKLKNINQYSSLSITFATLSAVITSSLYLVCTQWSCHYIEDTLPMLIYVLSFWNSYFLAHLFLYLIFVGRLFNPHYRRLYLYPESVRYSLWMLLFVMTMIMIEFNIAEGLYFADIEYPESISFACNVFYAVIDITISILTMILFFCPMCRRTNVKSNRTDMSVIKKYGILSTLQLVAAVSFQVSTVGAPYGFNPIEFWYIAGMIQMLDCLLLVICIYFGFARKPTVCTLRRLTWNCFD